MTAFTSRPVAGRSRREAARLFAAAGVAAVTLTSVRARAEDQALYYTWAGYDQDAFRGPYIQKHGAPPQYAFFENTEEAFQKMQQGYAVDVAHPCMTDIGRWHDAGIILPLDTSRIPAWGDLIPALVDNSSVHVDGQYLLAPWEWGPSSLVYRTDRVELPDGETYAVMLDERHKGRISFPDTADDMPLLAALLGGVKDFYHMADADYATVKDYCERLVKQARFVWSDPTTAEQAMANDELDMFWGWPNSWLALKKQGLPVGYMQHPKEGIVTWVCGFTIMKDHPHDLQLAYDLINASLDPVSGKNLVEMFGYGHSNLKTYGLVDPKTLADLGLDTDVSAYLAKSNFLQQRSPDMQQRLVRLWNDALAQASM
jgi:spermidine/putrescine-binding protein